MKYRLIAIATLAIAGHPSLMAGYRVIGDGSPEAPYTVPVPVPVAPMGATTPYIGVNPGDQVQQVLAARVQALEAENRTLRERLRESDLKLGIRSAPSTEGAESASFGFEQGRTVVAQPVSKKAEILARARAAVLALRPVLT